MGTDVNQGRIIRHLNAYLEKQNLPFRMNKTGVCNGLAALHAEYALKGELGKFQNILKFIADGTKVEGISEEDIDRFAVRVAATFDPKKYNLKLRQTNAIEMLSVNGHALKSSFDLALVANDKNWESVFQELALKNNEVMQVSSVNHAISIQKINNVYAVYDPNYSEGYKYFSNEKDLVKELHSNVFTFSGKNMGLQLQVIRHPEDLKDRPFPEVTSIYDRFLPDVNAVAFTGDQKFTTLSFAAWDNDGSIIDYLLKRKPTDIWDAIGSAIVNNNPRALRALLPEINDKDKRYSCIKQTLEHGRKEAFEVLMQDQEISASYNKMLVRYDDENNVFNISDIAYAAKGGNPELLQYCIEQRINHLIARAMPDDKTISEEVREAAAAPIKKNLSERISEAILAYRGKPNDPLLNAVKSGSKGTVQVLVEQLHKTNHQLSDTDKIKYLREAISNNHFHVASYLISEKPAISPEMLNSIQMSTLAVERTNIALLNLLKTEGMTFSSAAQKIIDSKNKGSLTFIESLSVAVAKFTDFFKDNLSNREERGVKYDPKLFKQMKERMQEVKSNIVDLKDSSLPEIIPLTF
ncbi:Ankyrin repeats (3 copies) [Legionella massiliensis]|uniref:Ankyrin repeats (3 copies) n=1 Tax=Legionella massiliensis TaxID=1034943 RepID=A0A078KU16_9GAMM|nr:hypothetical protein [Legionella massiliensis]CDZ76452.1 Ankyrin repeats (3 copies) [Legionella massiliensis]CEE12190.1 Ankyrin repeats (3 copies) [Legionella massiliensis]